MNRADLYQMGRPAAKVNATVVPPAEHDPDLIQGREPVPATSLLNYVSNHTVVKRGQIAEMRF